MSPKLLLIMASLTLGFTACTKESTSDNFMRGKIDGTSFDYQANLSANTPEPTGRGVSDPTLRIKGLGSANDMIELFILSESTSIQTGVYPFTVDKMRSAKYTSNGTIYYAGPPSIFLPGPMIGSGSITITAISKRHVSGNFEFTTGSPTHVISEGAFSIDRN